MQHVIYGFSGFSFSMVFGFLVLLGFVFYVFLMFLVDSEVPGHVKKFRDTAANNFDLLSCKSEEI